jgi:hypothetical protein
MHYTNNGSCASYNIYDGVTMHTSVRRGLVCEIQVRSTPTVFGVQQTRNNWNIKSIYLPTLYDLYVCNENGRCSRVPITRTADFTYTIIPSHFSSVGYYYIIMYTRPPMLLLIVYKKITIINKGAHHKLRVKWHRVL